MANAIELANAEVKQSKESCTHGNLLSSNPHKT